LFPFVNFLKCAAIKVDLFLVVFVRHWHFTR